MNFIRSIFGFVRILVRLLLCFPSGLLTQQTVCPALTEPPLYGTIQDSQCYNQVGSTCNFNCAEGMEPIGNTTRVCGSDGNWSGRELMCINSQISCPFLNPDGLSSAPSLVGGCLLLAGSRCYFACRPDHVLVGQDNVSCFLNGSWSNALPSCESRGHTSCPLLHDPPNGQVNTLCKLTHQRIGISCRFTCNPNYQLIGLSTVQCLSTGEWSASTPICQSSVSCPAFVVANAFPLSGAACTGVSQIEVGTVCIVQCMQGYRILNGISQLTCLTGGSWSSPQPICEFFPRCPPVKVANAQQTGSGCATGSAEIQVGSTCSFQCLPGYTLTGASNLYCLSGGVWSTPPPTCKVVINGCPVISVQNAYQLGIGCGGFDSTVPVGSTCIFECAVGYVLTGSRELHCQQGQTWSALPPSCLFQPNESFFCPTLFASAPLQTSGSCVNANVGQVCSFSCKGNFQLQGQAQLFCQSNGQWSGLGEMPACIERRCTSLPVPFGGTHIGGYSLELGHCSTFCPGIPGQYCRLVCANGFRLVGSDSRVLCSASSLQWEPRTLPICEQIIKSSAK